MKTNTQRWMLSTITALAAVAFVATSSFAETPKTATEDSTGQTMYPGMYGGMGPGHMGYVGMGPGYMQQGGMGPGYMRQGGMGYGMGYGGMGMLQALNLDKDQRAKLRPWQRLLQHSSLPPKPYHLHDPQSLSLSLHSHFHCALRDENKNTG